MCKRIVFLFLLLFLLINTSCTDEKEGNSVEFDTDISVHNTVPQKETYSVANGLFYETGDNADLQQVELYSEGEHIYISVEGVPDLTKQIYDVPFLRDYELSVGDIDADGFDEIVANICVDHAGGFGRWFVGIYSVKNHSFSALAEWEQDDYDTGFSSKYLPNKEIEIYNEFTEDKFVFDISNRYAVEFFDENGVGKYYQIYVDEFYSCVSKDIDNDGICELLCKQYVSLCGHSDGLGSAISTLKYDATDNKFYVVNCDFELFD